MLKSTTQIHNITTDTSPKFDDCLDKSDVINQLNGFIDELYHTPSQHTMDWVESEMKQWHILTIKNKENRAWVSNAANIRKTTHRRSLLSRIMTLIKTFGVWKSEYTETSDVTVVTRCSLPLQVGVTTDGDGAAQLTLKNKRWAIALYRIKQLIEEQESPSAIFKQNDAVRNSNILKGWAASQQTEPTDDLRQNLNVDNLFDIINNAEFAEV